MLDLNLPNFITVALIAIVAIWLVRLIAKSMNKPAPV